VDNERPLTEEELGRLERWVRGVVEKRHDSNAMVEWGAEELARALALSSSRSMLSNSSRRGFSARGGARFPSRPNRAFKVGTN
jgi:hypothetical protein